LGSADRSGSPVSEHLLPRKALSNMNESVLEILVPHWQRLKLKADADSNRAVKSVTELTSQLEMSVEN